MDFAFAANSTRRGVVSEMCVDGPKEIFEGRLLLSSHLQCLFPMVRRARPFLLAFLAGAHRSLWSLHHHVLGIFAQVPASVPASVPVLAPSWLLCGFGYHSVSGGMAVLTSCSNLLRSFDLGSVSSNCPSLE